MATAKTMMVVDGRLIRAGEEIPDLGSWVAVQVSGRIRNYSGLSTDVEKLPCYVGTGSLAFCVDTGDIYEFEKSSGAWYKKKANPGGCECEDHGNPTDYRLMQNKPRINGVELDGDVTLEELGISGLTAGGVTFSIDEENECLQIEYGT